MYKSKHWSYAHNKKSAKLWHLNWKISQEKLETINNFWAFRYRWYSYYLEKEIRPDVLQFVRVNIFNQIEIKKLLT